MKTPEPDSYTVSRENFNCTRSLPGSIAGRRQAAFLTPKPAHTRGESTNQYPKPAHIRGESTNQFLNQHTHEEKVLTNS